MTTIDIEKRQQPRLPRDEKLFVQVVAPGEQPLPPGDVLFCTTVDISASGLQLRSSMMFPVGCSLDLWVKVDGQRKYLLNGEVKRCVERDNQNTANAEQALTSTSPGRVPKQVHTLYMIGIQINHAQSQDSAAWQELFATPELIAKAS
jgi:hypothetical protein